MEGWRIFLHPFLIIKEMKYILSILFIAIFSIGVSAQYTFVKDCPNIEISYDGTFVRSMSGCHLDFRTVSSTAFELRDGALTTVIQISDTGFADNDAAFTYFSTVQDSCCAALSGTGINAEAIVDITGAQTLASVTTSGNTTADIQLLSVSNIGAAAGVFDGVSLPVGTTVTYTAYLDPESNEFVRVKSFTYDATGTTFLILETP